MFNSYGVLRDIDGVGRVTLPKAFRDAFGIDCGDSVEICRTDDSIVIRPVSKAISVDENQIEIEL